MNDEGCLTVSASHIQSLILNTHKQIFVKAYFCSMHIVHSIWTDLDDLLHYFINVYYMAMQPELQAKELKLFFSFQD